ncbi:MAG: circadian clock KaiB family protein [Verrucomicrobia bacterium]|nr:circadian clock KaiB family protein [Verrucomicrobiota bacterium]
MPKRIHRLNSTEEFENALNRVNGRRYVLRLFITGITVRSSRTIANVRSVCEEYLKDRYDLTVVDIYQQPSSTLAQQVIAAPTLIKSEPLPFKRLIGDLSDRGRVLVALGIANSADEEAPNV